MEMHYYAYHRSARLHTWSLAIFFPLKPNCIERALNKLLVPNRLQNIRLGRDKRLNWMCDLKYFLFYFSLNDSVSMLIVQSFHKNRKCCNFSLLEFTLICDLKLHIFECIQGKLVIWRYRSIESRIIKSIDIEWTGNKSDIQMCIKWPKELAFFSGERNSMWWLPSGLSRIYVHCQHCLESNVGFVFFFRIVDVNEWKMKIEQEDKLLHDGRVFFFLSKFYAIKLAKNTLNMGVSGNQFFHIFRKLKVVKVRKSSLICIFSRAQSCMHLSTLNTNRTTEGIK